MPAIDAASTPALGNCTVPRPGARPRVASANPPAVASRLPEVKNDACDGAATAASTAAPSGLAAPPVLSTPIVPHYPRSRTTTATVLPPPLQLAAPPSLAAPPIIPESSVPAVLTSCFPPAHLRWWEATSERVTTSQGARIAGCGENPTRRATSSVVTPIKGVVAPVSRRSHLASSVVTPIKAVVALVSHRSAPPSLASPPPSLVCRHTSDQGGRRTSDQGGRRTGVTPSHTYAPMHTSVTPASSVVTPAKAVVAPVSH